MAKLESTIKNMVLALLGVTFIAGCLLGFVNEVTKGPIAKTKAAREARAIKEVMPPKYAQEQNLDISKSAVYINKKSDELLSKEDLGSVDMKTVDSLLVFTVKSNNQEIGTAIKTFTEKGFNGRVVLMAGFDTNGIIQHISTLEHKETPGLGTKMAEESFYKQFQGKDPSSYKLKVSKDGGDVDAITAATISSRAFCDASQRACKVYKYLKK